MKSTTHPDETARLAALEALGIVHTPAEQRFDQFTAMAQAHFVVPIALFSLITDRSQWFKSSLGVLEKEYSRAFSLCARTIRGHDTLVVEDCREHDDYADNPLVTGPPGIRFYAAHPVSFRGNNIGTLSIIDRIPRSFSDADRETLRNLARWIENELNLRQLDTEQAALVDALDASRRSLLIDSTTGVWNRSGMDRLLASEMVRARGNRETVAAMMLGLDDFPRVSVGHGQDAANAVRREVARRIYENLRPRDLVSRYDDDVFMLFAGNCSNEAAMAISRRIQAAIAHMPVTVNEQSVQLTVSIGIAVAEATGLENHYQLIGSAVESLAVARLQGGNGMETAILV